MNKTQKITILTMAAFAAVMFAGPIAMNSSFAGDYDGFFLFLFLHHHYHHYFFFGNEHHHHHDNLDAKLENTFGV
jgi:hypothetical protein